MAATPTFPSNGIDEPETDDDLLDEDPEYEDPEPEPKTTEAAPSEPQYNEDIPHEALLLYKAAMLFVERMARGQKHLAMKESFPNLQTALKNARPVFLTD